MKLEGKIAYITGADSGIGQATAELFANEGADIAIGYHTDAAGARDTARLVEETGRRAVVCQLDVGDPASVDAFFAACLEGVGRPNVFVANARLGMGEPKPAAEMDQQSLAGHLPTPDSAPYGMAKAGVNSLVRSLSIEVAPDRFNVNAIAPGLIATPMTQKRLDDPEKREQSMQAIPWRRLGKTKGGCRPGIVPGCRSRRLRRRPDLDDGRLTDDGLGWRLAAAISR